MDQPSIEPDVANLSDADALKHIALLIDSAWDSRSAADTDLAFKLLDQIRTRSLSPDPISLAEYFRANAWANREKMRANLDVWSWEQPESQEQILALRRAVRNEGFQQLPRLRHGCPDLKRPDARVSRSLCGHASAGGHLPTSTASWGVR